MTAKRYEEVFEFNNEVIRIGCPKCGYPMRVLAKDDDNIYQCYCASCKTDRFMKDTFDVEVLTVKQFKRDMNRGKGVDGERISDLIYNLIEENEELKQSIADWETSFDLLKQQLDSEHQQLENAILLERTRMGQNALKQYKEAIE